MSQKKDQSTQVDLNTLNQLPIAVAIFDNKKVFFINKKAAELFHISKEQLKNINSVSIFQFLDSQYHNRIKQNNTKILKGEEFPPVELSFKTFKGKQIFIEAKSNSVLFENKKAVQTTFIEISKLKQKQIDLELSESLLLETKEKFDLITKSSNDIIAFYTYLPKGKYLYVSPNVTKILGYDPKDLLNDRDFFNKRVIGEKKEFLQIDNIIKNYQKKNIKKHYSYTYKTIKKNKEEVWLENSLTPIFNSAGKIEFFLNIIRDITIQKEKEIEIKLQHLNYQNLLDNSPGAYIIHRQGVTVFCNRATLKLLQLKSEKQILGKFTLDYIIEKDRMKAMERIKDIYKGIDVGKASTWTLKDTKGNLIEVQLTSTPINYNNSNCILTLIINLTEQRKAETEKLKAEMIKINNEFLLLEVKERQAAEKKLLEKTAQLSSIFESSTHLIWTINEKFEVTSFNKNFSDTVFKKFGLKLKPGTNISNKLKNQKQEYIKLWHTKYKEAFAGKKVEFEREDINNNKKVFRKVFINPIFNNNKVVGVSCIAHDITETKVYENKLINQSAKLEAIFESGDQLIWTFNRNYELTSFNQNYFKLLKKEKQKLKVLFLKDTIVDKKLFIFWKQKFDLVFKGEHQVFVHKSIINKKTIYREIFMHPIFFEGKIIEASAIAQDITERMNNENKILEQSAKLKAIFESGTQAMWTINKERQITSCNKNYEAAILKSLGVKPDKNLSIYSKQIAKKNSSVGVGAITGKQYDIAFSGKSTEFTINRTDLDKIPVTRQIYLQPIFNKAGEVEEVSGIAYDITEKKTAELKLLNQAAKLNSIFESSHHYIWTIDNNFKLTSFNKNYFDLITEIYGTKPFVGLKLDRGILSNNDEYISKLDYNYKKALAGNESGFEVEILDKNYNKVYLEVFLNPIYNNEIIEEVSGIAHNVTEKKLNSQRVEQSLKEKEVLLKEVHHRVKNNMQIISSILNLQSSYVTDAYTLSLLKESQNRIKTMAYIHESLYQNKSFTSVNFSEYIQTLSKNIIQSYVVSSEKIELVLNVQKTTLSLDTSIPAGLIINELITNAIKHAFPNSRKGKIYLNLKTENNTIHLEVADDGVGIPSDLDYNNTNSLGLQLVNTLIDQLGGEIKFKTKKGKETKVLIKFKM
ncbi:PAS domain S-box protein [Sediminibacterium sp.]|uniref:PAS domain S-box protein n=1 Tax=Sediminibacterium sp. TaxID=1917865 RepID=UPI00273492D7|nr:PAS domain S-box protein [Sediminibacterium sp.]MDP3567540.1 PAS domain S-box protein [Sediminibacterium sp.]